MTAIVRRGGGRRGPAGAVARGGARAIGPLGCARRRRGDRRTRSRSGAVRPAGLRDQPGQRAVPPRHRGMAAPAPRPRHRRRGDGDRGRRPRAARVFGLRPARACARLDRRGARASGRPSGNRAPGGGRHARGFAVRRIDLRYPRRHADRGAGGRYAASAARQAHRGRRRPAVLGAAGRGHPGGAAALRPDRGRGQLRLRAPPPGRRPAVVSGGRQRAGVAAAARKRTSRSSGRRPTRWRRTSWRSPPMPWRSGSPTLAARRSAP